jgi:hypothetical protein
MSLVSDIINEAFLDLGTITVNEAISTAMQNDAFMRLNQLLDSLNAEGLLVPNQVTQTFATGSGTGLVAGQTAYTLGSGGTLPTTGSLRAMKVTAWRAYYGGVLYAGGRVLSMPEFGELAKQNEGELTAIPRIVAADTSYPLINVRVFPPPSATPGSLELSYYTPIAQFALVSSSITLPQGFEDMLHWNLARRLYAQYPRPSNMQMIWDMADRTKVALLTENAMTAPQPQAAAPQGQK